MNGKKSGAKQPIYNRSFLLLVLLLGGTLAVLCREGFRPYMVFWVNDLPLGALMESSARLPSSFFGSWADFYWLGGPNVAFPPTLTNISMAIFSPQHQLKFYVPGCMFFFGFGAWFFFRQLRLSKWACVLGGLAAGLNMHFFSNACWGLGQWDMCCGLIFIALGVLVSPVIKQLWIKGALAGMAVGLAVMEGYDVGAILSIYVAIFVVFLFLSTEENPARGAGKSVYLGFVLVLSAVLISLSTIYTLVGTQIVGTGGAGQSESAKRDAWDANTQFSIPKLETLRMVIPGLFGYRLDMYTTSTNPATYYWGRVAEDPHIDELESDDALVRSNAAVSLGMPDQVKSIMASDDKTTQADVVDRIKGFLQRRHTGNGEYVGILVCLLAFFGLANAARGGKSPYALHERRAVWFWGAAALVSLLAAWGRHGFLYAFIYRLPLTANFRNPQKYMHPLNISLIILSGYGLEALARQYLAETVEEAGSFFHHLAARWKQVTRFEIGWAVACAVLWVGALYGYFVMATPKSKAALVEHLLHNGFDGNSAPAIANFSVSEVEWFVLYFAASAGLVACILAGVFSGRLAIWAWVCLSAIMICDLSRSDIPWIRLYNYKEKISLNPVTEILRHEPWEHRVNSRVWPAGGYMTPNLTGLCHWWIENDYPFNDIQSLEIDQAPRMPVLDSEYLGLFAVNSEKDIPRAARLWRLTNTRYLVAGAEWVPALNQLSDTKDSFRYVMRLDVANKPGIVTPEDAGDQTVVPKSNGPVALIEYTAALPRAKLYANWKTADDPAVLAEIGSPQFDPEHTVIVAKDTPLTQTPGIVGTDAGTVKITQYASKDILLEADAKTSAVLLLNDRTGDYWNVWVDQKPAAVLRCNLIMRGVWMPAGHHTIEFRYQPPLKLLYVSLATFATGIILAGFVIATNARRKPEEQAEAPDQPPAKT